MTRPIHALFVAAGVAALAWAAHAAVPIQLRVTVSPGKGQAAWEKPGILFQKTGECVYSSTANLPATWPVTSGVVGSGKATAPLFNPGFPVSDGSYLSNSSDDGFNTIFLPLTGGEDARTVVCRGTILANGKDVTAATAGRVVSRSVEAISNGGPPTVTVTLDPGKLATVPVRGVPTRPHLPPAAVTPTVLRQGSFQFFANSNSGDLESGKAMASSGPLPAGAGARDVWVIFTPTGEGLLRLSPGAQFASALGGSDSSRGYDGCKGASYAASSDTLPQGKFLCIRTAEGHLAEIKALLSKAGTSPYGVASYTVWN